MEKKTGFNLRSFTSFSLVLSTIIMSWSGFILYIAPPGRIANWGTWKLMLFTKAEWQALHTIFSYLFFILAVIHLLFVNWKAFMTYFKSKVRAGLNRKYELGAASVLTILLFAGTLRAWTPFDDVMAFGEKMKEGWESEYKAPEIAHMELYTIEKLAASLDSIDPAKVLAVLSSNNIKASGKESTLKEIAAGNEKTPSEIYDLITGALKAKPRNATGEAVQGLGKYTVETLAQKTGMSSEVIIGKLKQKGIEATPASSLRELAGKMGTTPRELYDMLTIKSDSSGIK